jgi:multidrug efflux pump subunit AcrA (membrane-fusion protein)
MKSLKHISFLTFAAVAALVIAGCGHKEGDSHVHESGEGEEVSETQAGVAFNAKKGLLVSPSTAKLIGLQVADVEVRQITATFEFSAQIYRAASEAQFVSPQPSGAPATLASGQVSPADAAKLSEGQSVSVQSRDSVVSLPGCILRLKRDLEKASGQVEVLLAIASAQQPLTSGAFISVTVPLGGEQNVVGVPRSALFRTTEGDFVYTASGEHFVRTPVKLGVVNHEYAEITDGLYAGDQIVTRPVMSLWLAELQSLRGGKACADGH